MKERWIVRVLVDRDPDVDLPPAEWGCWDVEDTNAVVLSAEVVGLVAVPVEWVTG